MDYYIENQLSQALLMLFQSWGFPCSFVNVHYSDLELCSNRESQEGHISTRQSLIAAAETEINTRTLGHILQMKAMSTQNNAVVWPEFVWPARYDFVGHQETLQQDTSQLLKILMLQDDIQFPPSYENLTTHAVLLDWFSAVPLEDRRKLYELYEQDFRMFGYKRPRELLDGEDVMTTNSLLSKEQSVKDMTNTQPPQLKLL